MKAAILASPQPIAQRPLQIVEVADPRLRPGHVLLRVRACGVCRTDLHIVEGDLPPKQLRIIPGHQIVGEVVDGATEKIPLGLRVGVSWLGGTDGTCPYCQKGMENLCDSPTFTGYSVAGGYAQYVFARADFVFPLPEALDDLHAAPLLCAGIIGFRSLRVAGVEPGERVGLFGFGASAHLAIAVLQAWKCDVYVSTRGKSHRELAASLGATWVGNDTEKPPVELDRAVTFAPSGDVVISALSSLRKGGVVAINAIHLDRIPQFDYDRLLWGERQLRSVANMTRADARDFLSLAAQINLQPKVTVFSLDQANEALQAVKNDAVDGAAVIVPPEVKTQWSLADSHTPCTETASGATGHLLRPQFIVGRAFIEAVRRTMAKVTGIGGAFLRSKDPKALYAWYEKHLALERRDGCFMFEAAQQRSRAVVAFFPASSDYFPVSQPAMLNFQVDDLDALLDALIAAGVEVDSKRDRYDFGDFGWFKDPDGNRVELWQPK